MLTKEHKLASIQAMEESINDEIDCKELFDSLFIGLYCLWSCVQEREPVFVNIPVHCAGYLCCSLCCDYVCHCCPPCVYTHLRMCICVCVSFLCVYFIASLFLCQTHSNSITQNKKGIGSCVLSPLLLLLVSPVKTGVGHRKDWSKNFHIIFLDSFPGGPLPLFVQSAPR